MINTTQIALWFRMHRHFAIIACLVLASACSTQGTQAGRSGSTGSSAIGVAIIGSATKVGLNAPVSKSQMSAELAAQLATRSRTTITPSPSVRTIIGPAPHDEMMAFFARHGRFAPYQVQRLMAANLPASQALAVRLESDSVERLPVLRRDIINAQGRVVSGRERHNYVTRRTTMLSATMLNLRNGRVIWTRQYRVSPEALVASDHLLGESFSTSVAAVVANTLVHGIDDTKHPPPPPLVDSIAALLREVAYNAPLR